MKEKYYTPAELNAYKFVKDPVDFKSVHNSYIERCMVACMTGKKIDDNIKQSVQKSVNEGICVSKGFAALGGWSFDFRPYLKRYVINQYGRWYEYYAFNKTLLRKMVYGKIDEIVEIPEKK